MTKRNHSIGLKLFIFLLVAMMLFSAIGVMVIYLNVPTTTTTVPVSLPAEPTTITLPSTAEGVEEQEVVNNEEEVAPTPQPTEEVPSEVVEPAAQEITDEQAIPTEDAPVEPTVPAQE